MCAGPPFSSQIQPVHDERQAKVQPIVLKVKLDFALHLCDIAIYIYLQYIHVILMVIFFVALEAVTPPPPNKLHFTLASFIRSI